MAISDRLNKLTTDITNAYTSIENKLPKILPEGYTQVEYIESTGTQYIDTGYKINNNCSAKYKYEYISGNALSGVYNGYQDLYFGIVRPSTGKLSYRYSGEFYEGNIPSTNTIYNVEVSLKKNNQYLKVNNIIEQESQSNDNFTNNLNCYIFNINNLNFVEKISAKLYYFKIYDNDVLVRHFIPCYRNSDNEIGLYDTVNNVFYTNQGTGTFLKGKNNSIGMDKNTNNLSTAIDSIEVIEQQTAEGESLSLVNTKAMPYKDYVVKGKREQATRSGKNAIIDEYASASSYITWNLDKSKVQNSMIFSGIFSKSNNSTIYFQTSGGTIVGGSISVTANQKVQLTITLSNDDLNKILTSTYTPRIQIYGGDYSDIEYSEVMYRKTNTDDTYEPYGASPSPDYPSDIHSVADDVNLLPYPYSISIYNQNGLKVTFNNDGTMTLNGTTNNVCYVNVIGTGDEKTLKAGTYTLKAFVNGLTRFRLFDVTNTRGFDDTGNGNTFTITEDISYRVYFEIPSNVTFNNAILKPKLQKGTEATPYSPYNQGTVTIKQRGKNLFNTSNITSNVTDYTITVQDGGFIIRTGGMSNGVYFGLLKDLCPNLKVGDKFKFTWDSNATRNGQNVMYVYLQGYNQTIYKDTLYTCTQTMLDSSVAFYGQQGEYYKNIIFYLDGQTADYEPYNANDYTFQTEPLRSLPNGVKDTIEADGIHRRVGRVVLDGSENWTNKNITDNNILFSTNKIDNLFNTTNLTNLTSNYFNVNSSLWTNDNEGVCLFNMSASLRFRINKNLLNNISTVENAINSMKTWLSTHNTEVLYELETEIIEPLTQNQATTMLDIIKTGSYEGTTNIYTDEDVKPTMGVGYYKKD